MKNITTWGTAQMLGLVLCLGAPLLAQEARFGGSLDLATPTGGFASTNYGGSVPSNNGYDSGVGVQFLVCLPVQEHFAVRLNVGTQSFSGTSNAPGYDSLNLSDSMVSLGAEMQLFLGRGSSYRQSGTYLLAGAAMDFERFDATIGYPGYDPGQSTSASRVAGTVGVGHLFRSYRGVHYLWEVAYHKTLTQTNLSAGNQPGSDFFKFSMGCMF